jgi:hypothetical protein
MNAKPLAEVYEELKSLRRQGGERDIQIQTRIVRQLRMMYPHIASGGVTDQHFMWALVQALNVDGGLPDLIRMLEIKTLAYRVFGDEEKADAWLERPNISLSGQKPADLVKDELGTAVVREMLERIDHGIFA